MLVFPGVHEPRSTQFRQTGGKTPSALLGENTLSQKSSLLGICPGPVKLVLLNVNLKKVSYTFFCVIGTSPPLRNNLHRRKWEVFAIIATLSSQPRALYMFSLLNVAVIYPTISAATGCQSPLSAYQFPAHTPCTC